VKGVCGQLRSVGWLPVLRGNHEKEGLDANERTLGQMNANNPAVVRTRRGSGNLRVRSAEGIYEAKTRPEFDSEARPERIYLRSFALICVYLR
jgi:hypothetical protein